MKQPINQLKISLCLRFVDRSTGQVEVREEFVGFLHAKSIHGQALATLLLNTMDKYEVDGDKLRAQGYDGAANMSRKHQGVQAHVRQLFPEAVYVHCKSHCLNLAIGHSCKDASVRTLMGTIQDTAFAFDYSAKKKYRLSTIS